MKRKKFLFIIKIVVVLFIAILLFNFVSDAIIMLKHERKDKIFTDISKMVKLDEYVITDIDISSDKFVDIDRCKNHYTKEINYKGHMFKVYAYEFSTNKDAQLYFGKITGIYYWDDQLWSSKCHVGAFSRCYYVIYYQNNLLYIKCTYNQTFVDFVNFLNSDFEIDTYDLLQEEMNK